MMMALRDGFQVGTADMEVRLAQCLLNMLRLQARRSVKVVSKVAAQFELYIRCRFHSCGLYR